jgi:hypothetical protein
VKVRAEQTSQRDDLETTAPPRARRVRRAPRLGIAALLLLGCHAPGGAGRRGTCAGGTPTARPSEAARTLHPGLQYREQSCQVGEHTLRLRQLELRAGAGLELRAQLNPTARTDARCGQRYGGEQDIRHSFTDVPGFRVLGATNGNFFHRLGEGFRSNGMIWSREGVDQGVLLAPVQPTSDPDFRGDHVFIADAHGGHEVRIATGDCTPGECRVSIVPPPATPAAVYERLRARPQPMSEADFIAALREAFPSMTLALQINHAYAEPEEDPQASSLHTLAPSFRCSPTRTWTCRAHPVTLLCAARDGSVSLLTAESISYPALPAGLRPGGPCGTECEQLYILDGGGSAQIGYIDPSDGHFELRYAGRIYEDPAPGCARYRPVDHYLTIGTPLSSDAR